MRLMAITPGDARDLAPWLEAIGRAGWHEVLIREPGLTEDELHALCEEANRWVRRVIVHTRNPHAAAVAAELALPVHTPAPQPGFAPPSRAFGASCHDAAQLDRAFEAGADYALLSPVWRTSKPGDDRRGLGIAGFERLAAGRPVYALGGVRPGHMLILREIGAHGAAMMGGIFGQATPQEAGAAATAYLRG